MNNQLAISVVIATKDRQQIFDCLDSLQAQEYLPKEIIIVDASTDEGIKTKLSNLSTNSSLRVKYISTEAGLTLQRNIGVSHATGDLIAFFDDDVVLNRDFLLQTVSVFENDQQRKIGGVTGRMTNEIAPRWSVINLFRYLTFFSYPAYGKIRISGFHTEYNWCDKPLKVEWLHGAAAVYRKEVFKDFSFDENLKGYAYNEDLDFSYRVSQKYECWYMVSAKLLHLKSESRLSPSVAKAVVVNNKYLLHKNILPGAPLLKQLICKTTFYIAIFSFLAFLLLTGRFNSFREGVRGLLNGGMYNDFEQKRNN